MWHKLFFIRFWLAFSIFYVLSSMGMIQAEMIANHWKAGPWSSCYSPKPCGEGTQKRDVSCVTLTKGLILLESDCNLASRPPSIRSCFRVCQLHKPFLRWSVGPWSACRLQSNLSACGEGFVSTQVGRAARDVHCMFKVSKNGYQKVVPDSSCAYFWTRPASEQACSLECPQDCISVENNGSTDDWETELESSEVLVAPEPGGRPCPETKNRSPCFNGQQCVVGSGEGYTLKTEGWSLCTPIQPNSSSLGYDSFSMVPSIGRTTRKVSCLDKNGEIVRLKYCHAVEPMEQFCVVGSDCQTSPWSKWRVEQEGCRNSVGSITPEIRSRVRILVKSPLGNGASCGPLYERRVFSKNLPLCHKYKWVTSEWSDCMLHVHGDRGEISKVKPTCGGGVQIRSLVCIRILDQMPVNESLCLETRPASVQHCSVTCIRDCKVSNWSRWGPCRPFSSERNPLHLPYDYYRFRSRSVLVQPFANGQECPHLQEIIACEPDETLNYRYGNWSDCQPRNPGEKCGKGLRTRDFTCMAFGGEIERSICLEIMKNTSLVVTEEKCRVPCPTDCVLSDWSDWTPCNVNESTSGVITRNRSKLAIVGKDGRDCSSRSVSQRNCDGNLNCRPMHWIASTWSSCIPSDLSSTCGPGYRTKKIRCNEGNCFDEVYNNCDRLDVPEREQECYIPCPVDCIVTNFTDWTSCSSPCSTATQSRQRFVLRENKHGGKACPELLVETRTCKDLNKDSEMCFGNMLKREMATQWHTSNWSECILPRIDDHCGTGFQIRNVSCIDIDGYAVEMHRCTKVSDAKPVNLKKLVELVPSYFRLCHVRCPFNEPSCTLSAWSAWSECDHRFNAGRTRTREFIGDSAEKAYCRKKYPLEEKEKCPFLSLRFVDISQWGSCIVEANNRTLVGVNAHATLLSCGQGYRYKAGLKIKRLDEVEPGLEKSLCLVDCPMDCVMSEWSRWTECDVACGQGYRSRTRHVLRPANHLGRPCPPSLNNRTEEQKEVCKVPCSSFGWFAYGWEECIPTNSKNSLLACGDGIRRRTVRCMNEVTGSLVHEKHCDPQLKPAAESLCRMHCPGECVVSEWVTWKSCFNPCRSGDYLEKRRRVLRAPDEKHSLCPKLVKKEACVFNETCFEYVWKLGPWGTCSLPEGALCGEGVIQRALLCTRSDGRQVDGMHCEQKEDVLSLKHEVLSKPCYVDCPIDCVMSEWSDWNTTNCMECGKIGMRTRKREIVQAPSDAGQPCPSEMEQKIPCPFKPCYHWHVANWSTCDLQGAECGVGVRRRLVRCVRYDDLQVDKIHCLITNLTFTTNNWLDPKWLIQGHDKSEEEECHVQCPGDCVLSEWSDWGHCNKDCTKGQQVGYQTSSRFIIAPKTVSTGQCSTVLHRIRPCWGLKCWSFAWKYRNQSLNCERSDGLIVKGGCTRMPHPCHPNCESVFGGKCDYTTGRCYCQFSNRKEIDFRNPDHTCWPSPTTGSRRPVKGTANHTAPTQAVQDIQLKYYPDDKEVSFWMYAMISIGTAFVIFVAVTVYLMCRSSIHRRMVSVHRQASVRRRELGNQEKLPCRGTNAVANKAFE